MWQFIKDNVGLIGFWSAGMTETDNTGSRWRLRLYSVNIGPLMLGIYFRRRNT